MSPRFRSIPLFTIILAFLPITAPPALAATECKSVPGIGAEIAAVLSERCFEYLDGPLVRVTAPDTPVPYSPPLEEAFLPNAEKLCRAARALSAY